jgi:hypothetical protein
MFQAGQDATRTFVRRTFGRQQRRFLQNFTPEFDLAFDEVFWAAYDGAIPACMAAS